MGICKPSTKVVFPQYTSIYTKTFNVVHEVAANAPARISVSPLTTFGFFSVTAMVVCYALEDRSPAFILAFAGACVLGSIYGFMAGTWPFGAVELVWSAIAVNRWRKSRAL